ncbi:MAG: LTA synthase family protein [FCB group bacterium]|nr:LTA synthase family protein [FCB group bacterium]
MKRLWIIHPLLFAAFPVLFLYAQNAEKMRLAEITGPLAYCLAGAAVLTLVLSAIIRNMKKAALLATLLVILIFSFGHAIQAIGEITISPFGLHYETDDIVAVSWIALLGINGGLIIRTRCRLDKFTAVICQVGLILVLIQLAQGGYALASMERIKPVLDTAVDRNEIPDQLPDVYFIIMDAFGREDVLREVYDVDISDFTSFLRERGFMVADESHSNYIKTIYSLSATMNFNFLDSLDGYGSQNKSHIRKLSAKYLKDNKLFKDFKNMGYTIVSFATTGVSYTEAINTDVLLETSGGMKEFQQMLVSTTPLSFVLSEQEITENPRRQLVLSILEKLSDIHEVQSPKVVFAHVMSPHSPFVFGPDGDYVPQKNQNPDARQGHDPESLRRMDCIDGYSGQVTYICKRLKGVIDDILDNYSDNKPIIILQGDHGPRCARVQDSFRKTNMKEIFSIMNAIYLPKGPVESFYDGISSVNTFRLIFNEYFNTDFDLLTDISYYCTDNRYFDFQEVPAELISDDRGPYSNLLEQEFDSLTTLDRMRLFQLGLTERTLEDCYAQDEPLMTFGGNQLEMADCRLSFKSPKRYSFEAIFIPHNRDLDLDLTLKLQLYRLKDGKPSKSKQPRLFTYQATLPIQIMPFNEPSHVTFDIALDFEVERYRVSIFRPGQRPPRSLPMDGNKRHRLRVVKSDTCCPN